MKVELPQIGFRKERNDELEKLTRPLMEWLCENYHPHVMITVTSTSAQLFEGVLSTGQIMDYVKD